LRRSLSRSLSHAPALHAEPSLLQRHVEGNPVPIGFGVGKHTVAGKQERPELGLERES